MDALRCRVKAAAVANLTDARYFAALGVDYLGFALEPGASGFVDADQVATLRDWIEGPALVGEFGHVDVARIVEQAAALRLDVIQVGPFGKTRELAAATELPVLQELIMGPNLGIEEAQRIVDGNGASVQAFIVNFSRNASTWEWLREQPTMINWLEELCDDFAVLLDVPAAPYQIDEILDTLSPEGLQLTGGEEEAVGVKDFDELDEWFEVLRVEA